MNKLSQENFHNFIASGSKVVEFNADWCIDCKRIAPDLPAIEEKFNNDFQFAEIDVDDARDIAEQYHVKGIPTFIIFQEGVEQDRLHSRNAKTKQQIESFLSQVKK
ncbi:thioredoxin family protein [Hazenella sp. IB182357]|uniref:Thioredoxin n=1 Tax=Polycladospora coralii TaxID=2771432 RepID=A0A926N8S3_9BACL|nr:thioredoxin family protein [Polycladospora coralii]MBD1372231.1 thioredoxin family protein [Polycladospora coralii]MBS7530730.1 thioredoxin family protein [Polycladospora coralii]